jgi:ferredoxin--NADP+ reductase
MTYIDPDTCCDCGLCVNECPVSAKLPLDDLPEPQRKFAPINAAYYRKT